MNVQEDGKDFVPEQTSVTAPFAADVRKNRPEYGAFIIIPLKYEGTVCRSSIETCGFSECPITTGDISENVRELFGSSTCDDRQEKSAKSSDDVFEEDTHASGKCYCIEKDDLGRALGCFGLLKVRKDDENYPLCLGNSYLYIFRTQVAFFCMQIRCDDMNTIYTLCNPGYAENSAQIVYSDNQTVQHEEPIDILLGRFFNRIGLKKFYDNAASCILDAYVYIVAVCSEYFRSLEEMRRITFNLHQMLPAENDSNDASEEDIRYVYAVQEPTTASYRWGCCVASQTISYAVAREGGDFDAEMKSQAEDGLPVVLLALYEKFTCQRFSQLTLYLKKKNMSEISKLKQSMLEFRAFGTVASANFSRWNNIRQIYAYLLEVNAIESAVNDIEFKINILAEHQSELQHLRNEMIGNLITLFGVISIVASVLDIIQILSGGGAVIWGTMIVSNIALILCAYAVLKINKS